MAGGLGPRFALEAGFLILLAAVATYARLDTTEIVLVMAAGWLVASVFEVLAARRERVYPAASWSERPGAAEDAEVAEEAAEEERVSWSRPGQPIPARVEEPAAAVEEATGEIRMPRRRRWLRRRELEVEQPPEEPAARPSALHVRLIRGSPPGQDAREQRQDAEAGS